LAVDLLVIVAGRQHTQAILGAEEVAEAVEQWVRPTLALPQFQQVEQHIL
jgi:hypothetical protein